MPSPSMPFLGFGDMCHQCTIAIVSPKIITLTYQSNAANQSNSCLASDCLLSRVSFQFVEYFISCQATAATTNEEGVKKSESTDCTDEQRTQKHHNNGDFNVASNIEK